MMMSQMILRITNLSRLIGTLGKIHIMNNMLLMTLLTINTKSKAGARSLKRDSSPSSTSAASTITQSNFFSA